MLSSNLLQRASVSVSHNFLYLLSILYAAMGEMNPRALFLLGDGLTRVPRVQNPRLHLPSLHPLDLCAEECVLWPVQSPGPHIDHRGRWLRVPPELVILQSVGISWLGLSPYFPGIGVFRSVSRCPGHHPLA